VTACFGFTAAAHAIGKYLVRQRQAPPAIDAGSETADN
jgi:hypothetical protein